VAPKGRRIRRPRVSPARQISRGLFTAFVAGLLLWPVYAASGTPRVFAICEVGAPLELWTKTAFGWPVATYGLLATIGAGMFLRPKIIQAATLTALTAIGVEVVEMAVNHGACRVRDLVPAFVGIGLAVAVHTALRSATPPPPVKVKRMKRRPPGKKRPLIRL